MAICGHQFQGGDGSDWVLSTSVGCLDESTTASRILRELFKKRCRNPSTETSGKCPKTLTASSAPRTDPPKKKHQPDDTLIVRRIPTVSSQDFDESQHLNGCPVKWLYNKTLLDNKKKLRGQRLCNQRSPRKDDVRRPKADNLRDRTPVEMKIHKINLMEKYTTDPDDAYTEKPQHAKNLDARRKLAAKLNWKLHDDTQEELPYETFSETGSRHNYFPPRPLLGLKPLLSALLAPHKTNCCCWMTQLRATAPFHCCPVCSRPSLPGKERASLSIQSLDLPLPLPEPELRPRLRSTNALRRRSKSTVATNKPHTAPQVTLKPDHKKQNLASTTRNELKVVYYNAAARRMSEQRKQTKSLSSLFYELKGKTNNRAGQQEEVLEEMLRDLTAEGQFKMKRFLQLGNSESGQGSKSNPGRKGKVTRGESEGAEESNPVCGKMRFFEKPPPRAVKTPADDLLGGETHPQLCFSTALANPPQLVKYRKKEFRKCDKRDCSTDEESHRKLGKTFTNDQRGNKAK